jgi:hypothetical protein
MVRAIGGILLLPYTRKTPKRSEMPLIFQKYIGRSGLDEGMCRIAEEE